MKTRFFFTTVVLLVAYLLNACGGALPSDLSSGEQSPGEQAAVKVRAVEVAFTGTVEAIEGNAWTINGQVLSVDQAVVRDGPFQVGDTIKVEGTVNADGSLTIARVEAPTAADIVNLPQLGNDNGNANDNLNSNDNLNTNDNLNSNDNLNLNNNDNFSDDNMNGNSNDDSSANANSNDDDDDSNANDNSNGDDDDSNANGNSNDDDDDDDDDDSGSNSNNDDSDDRSGGNGNDNDDD